MTTSTPPRGGPAFYPSPELPNNMAVTVARWRMAQWLRGLGDQLDALSQDPNQPPDFYPLGAWTAEKLRDILVDLRQQTEANTDHPSTLGPCSRTWNGSAPPCASRRTPWTPMPASRACTHRWRLRPPRQGRVCGFCIRCSAIYARPEIPFDGREAWNGTIRPPQPSSTDPVTAVNDWYPVPPEAAHSASPKLRRRNISWSRRHGRLPAGRMSGVGQPANVRSGIRCSSRLWG